MNHNKYNLKEGQVVWLDEKYRNKLKVGIFSFIPNKMYATIYAHNETGDM